MPSRAGSRPGAMLWPTPARRRPRLRRGRRPVWVARTRGSTSTSRWSPATAAAGRRHARPPARPARAADHVLGWVGRRGRRGEHHEHFDHTFGNETLRPGARRRPTRRREDWRGREAPQGARRDSPTIRTRDVLDIASSATTTFSSARPSTSATGGRARAPRPRHTAGDGGPGDADVVLAGDLVEESALRRRTGRTASRWTGRTLDPVLGCSSARSVVVPGHGASVDKDFVAER